MQNIDGQVRVWHFLCKSGSLITAQCIDYSTASNGGSNDMYQYVFEFTSLWRDKWFTTFLVLNLSTIVPRDYFFNLDWNVHLALTNIYKTGGQENFCT
jgi:hypothetical protein